MLFLIILAIQHIFHVSDAWINVFLIIIDQKNEKHSLLKLLTNET